MGKYSRPSGGGFGDMFSDDLSPGSYPCIYKGQEDIELPVHPKKGDGTEPGIAYTFEVVFPGEPPTMVIHKCRAVISKGGQGAPSKIYTLLCGMYGDTPPRSLLDDDAAVDAFFKSCEGKEFLMLVNHKVGTDGKARPQVVSVTKPSATGRRKAPVAEAPKAADTDDIPWG